MAKIKTSTIEATVQVEVGQIIDPLRLEDFQEHVQEAADLWVREILPVLIFATELYPPYNGEEI